MKAVRGFLWLCGLLILGAWVLSHLNRDTSAGNPSATQPVAQRQFKIGETVTTGYWTYRCNGTQWRPFIGSSEFDIQRPDADFLLVDLNIENNSNTPSSLPSIKLIDTQGREYQESSAGALLPGTFGVWKTLNPGVGSRGDVIFDVPQDRRYVLKVSGGLESDSAALIDLEQEEVPTSAPATALPGSNTTQESAVPTEAASTPNPPETAPTHATTTDPVCTFKVDPQYTPEALAAHISGRVELSFTVDENGIPGGIRVVQSLDPGLDGKAMEAVSKWRFSPATKDGKPVAVQATASVDFRIR